MCTVTVLPTAGGYLLATNRDESPRRAPAAPPVPTRLGERAVLYPRDGDAGGTWVAVDDAGHALCLLNGDRTPAAPPPADPLSRGLLVLDLLVRPDEQSVWEALDARLAAGDLPVRSFKLITAAPDAPPALIAFDGRALTRQRLDPAAVVVSSTFRSEEVHARRAAAFAALRDDGRDADAAARAAAQRRWHADHAPGAAAGDAFSVCMHREDASSVSFTQVEVGPERVVVRYRPGAPCAGAPQVEQVLARRTA